MPINPVSANVLFLNEQTLKDYSVINENVDMKMLTPIIRTAQDLYLTKVLGTALMVDLQNKIWNAQFNPSGTTLTAADTTLLDVYVSKLMVYLVMQEAPIFMTMKFMNKGIQIQNSDNSNPASDNQLQLLVDRAKNAADAYMQRTINYLIANAALYPTYMQYTSYDDVIPTQNGYRSSFMTSSEREIWGYTTDGFGGWGCIECDWRRYFA